KYASADLTEKGAYILAGNSATPEIVLIGTGSELQFALGAYEQLAAEGVKARIVSMPSWELFERQPAEYRASVFPANVTNRLAVEAGVEQGWHKYASDTITINSFGQSAPYEALYKQYGFTTENVVAKAKSMLK
ncbi:MAG: transketolase C-terminal domain-containing protein, partial [Bacteriovoracaceae bacterium]